MPPRHLFAADVAARKLFALKTDLTHQGQTQAERIDAIETSVDDLSERVTELETAIGGTPWSFAGDGVATTFDLVGAASIMPTNFLVTVAGIDQHGAFTLATITGAVRLTFSEAPPSGVVIVVRHLTQHARTP